jgi:hypothetical protein
MHWANNFRPKDPCIYALAAFDASQDWDLMQDPIPSWLVEHAAPRRTKASRPSLCAHQSSFSLACPCSRFINHTSLSFLSAIASQVFILGHNFVPSHSLDLHSYLSDSFVITSCSTVIPSTISFTVQHPTSFDYN